MTTCNILKGDYKYNMLKLPSFTSLPAKGVDMISHSISHVPTYCTFVTA